MVQHLSWSRLRSFPSCPNGRYQRVLFDSTIYCLLNYPTFSLADDCVRPTDPLYAPGGQAAFSDGFAFLLASHKSLAALNSRISKPVSMENFRPNIVADSFTAYAEDNWDSIVFESSPFISMKIVKPCARCKVPTIDPLTGIFDPNNEPTRTIKKFRSGKALGFRNEAWNGEVF